LDITIIVLAGPDETSGRFNRLGNHVVNQAVLVVDSGSFKQGFVLTVIGQDQQDVNFFWGGGDSNVLVIDLLENVLEPAIIFLHDGVLR